MCLYPKLIKNPKYKANKKNNYNPPVLRDSRVKYVPVGCGKCQECRKQKQNEWKIRLTEEIKNNREAIFATLTFSDEAYTKLRNEVKEKEKEADEYTTENIIATKAVRRMLERYRKKNKKSVKHWLITELGGNGTENLHLHGIIFKKMTKDELENYWQYGRCDNGKYVNEKTISYITKYVTKTDQKHKNYQATILCSSGIGAGYEKTGNANNNIYKEKGTNETYRNKNGTKTALPTYYRNKIYSEEEREKLWLEKLDRQERWVMGEKVDVSKNDDEYNKLVQYYRAINEQRGFGNNEKTFEQKEYEQAQRAIRAETRKQRWLKKQEKEPPAVHLQALEEIR